jgi:hypothetical protein
MKKLGKAVGAIAIAGAIAASGSAFTGSNTLPADVTRGYGEQQITGVTANSVTYTLDAAKENITQVVVVLAGNTTSNTIEMSFGSDVPAPCLDTVGGVTNPGVFATNTTYTCAFLKPVGLATKFKLAAS